jgi:sialic acid synthase SpsE
VSNYPAEAKDANLLAMRTLAKAFRVPVGFSDHTAGIEVALGATALGACIIEKHFTLDRTLPGPDHRASLEPKELGELVRGIRKIEKALGDGRKRPVDSEREIAAVARKSLVTRREIVKGQVVRRQDIALRRPGTGLPPSMCSQVVGRRAARRVAAGALLRWDMLK